MINLSLNGILFAIGIRDKGLILKIEISWLYFETHLRSNTRSAFVNSIAFSTQILTAVKLTLFGLFAKNKNSRNLIPLNHLIHFRMCLENYCKLIVCIIWQIIIEFSPPQR